MRKVYVGIDVAARECAICVMDARGVIQEQVTVRTSEKNLVDFLTSLEARVQVRQGIVIEGARLWAKRRRDETLSLLPGPLAAILASELAILDNLREQEASTRRLIAREAKNFPVIGALVEIPGIGLLLAARFVAFIITPHRFAGRRQLWRYCRLGIKGYESGGKKLRSDRLDRAGNGTLKDLSRKAFAA